MEERHERLQKARTDAGFKTATEAARRFGWNENTYRSIDNGTRGLTVEWADTCGDAYNVSPEWLLYKRDGSNKPDDLTALLAQVRGKIVNNTIANQLLDALETATKDEDK